MTSSWQSDFVAEADSWRARLGELGFSDDGDRLRGDLPWRHPVRGLVHARIEVELTARFPFTAPDVRVLDSGTSMQLTFHIDRPASLGVDGNLCLWDAATQPVEFAPWREPQAFLDRVRGWLEQTAVRWPDDDVCDLERYLLRDVNTLVLYDADRLAGKAGLFKTAPGPTPRTIEVTEKRRPGVIAPRGPQQLHSKDRGLAWVDDLGEVQSPPREWADVEHALKRTGEVARLIALGAVGYLLLRYSRNGHAAVLAVAVQRGVPTPTIRACESADTSMATRSMRAGETAAELADVRIAVVGVGALGSFAADILFRSGVRRLTLIDGERLRPGNVVRHLAGSDDVGNYKVMAVMSRLAATGFDVGKVKLQNQDLADLGEAVELVKTNNVVLDATAHARASSLLATAANITGAGTGHTVISACVQREGDIIRADRFPLRHGEQHLPALISDPIGAGMREAGCGEPVSRTPPAAVIAAADLACRMVIDQATRQCTLPASMADIRQPQTEPPFDQLGLLTPTPVAYRTDR
ncbi:ThiF family adenylyltransferase [Actinoplanes sp. DH11]|uniref:ThiF family adenylyltransferase n=1 Tax=Actinoplanes sp. DH11 TaxID=2857011 RepID=UPI001E4098FB|nr:ThiF family adenylyltransferase [Actinoplanes sp. DH11]